MRNCWPYCYAPFSQSLAVPAVPGFLAILPFFQSESGRNHQKPRFFCSFSFWTFVTTERQAHAFQVWSFSFWWFVWWGQTFCAPNSLELDSRCMPIGARTDHGPGAGNNRTTSKYLGTESCCESCCVTYYCSFYLPERCIRGILLRRLGLPHHSLRLHLRRGHHNQSLLHLHPDQLWHGQRQHHLRLQLLNPHSLLNHISIRSTHLPFPELHQRQLNICLDNLRHYTLRGLLRLRSSRQPPLCLHRHLLPLRQYLMQYQLHNWFLLQLNQWAPTQPLSIQLQRLL